MEVRDVDFIDDPCISCIVRPVCSCECFKSKSYELLIGFVLKYFNCTPNDKEIKEFGLSITCGGVINGRTKNKRRRKER